MKGTIVTCLEEMAEKRFGRKVWLEACRLAGVRPGAIFLPSAPVEDDLVRRLFAAVAEAARLTPAEVYEAFGDAWINDYASTLYRQFFAEYRTALDFLAAIDVVHAEMTLRTPDAHPPRFVVVERTPGRLVLQYGSARQMAALVPGLIRGVARHYRQELVVEPRGTNTFEVRASPEPKAPRGPRA